MAACRCPRQPEPAAIIHPLDAPDIPRQVRFDPLPLLIAQPKQIPAHDPNPLPKTNQDRIVTAEKLMSSDPRLSKKPFCNVDLVGLTDRRRLLLPGLSFCITDGNPSRQN